LYLIFDQKPIPKMPEKAKNFRRFAFLDGHYLAALPPCPPAFQPLPERCLALPGSPAGKKTFDAQVLVYALPMDTHPSSDQAPVRPLLRGRAFKPGVPSERHADRSAVRQINGQGVFRHTNIYDTGSFDLTRQNRHATPPQTVCDSTPQCVLCVLALHVRICCYYEPQMNTDRHGWTPVGLTPRRSDATWRPGRPAAQPPQRFTIHDLRFTAPSVPTSQRPNASAALPPCRLAVLPSQHPHLWPRSWGPSPACLPSAVDVAAVTDTDHQYDEPFILDSRNDPVRSHAVPPQIVEPALQGGAQRAGVVQGR